MIEGERNGGMKKLEREKRQKAPDPDTTNKSRTHKKKENKGQPLGAIDIVRGKKEVKKNAKERNKKRVNKTIAA